MANRKSSQKIQAHKKALEAAQKFQAQQEKLLNLAAEYFTLDESSGISNFEKQIEDLEEKIEKIRDKINLKREENRHEQARIISQMKEQGITVQEIGQRLDISTTEVRKYIKLISEAEKSGNQE